jgi:enamine deaminase RidA (YjgF/YER057c/UK114 family)/N-acetylglutamate synthase-like GNAT family acetyltransferase
MERVRIGSGAPWESRVGYSRAVRVGTQVFVTGTTGLRPDGTPVAEDDAGAQARQALENIARALEGLGSRLEDVVRTRMYVTDIARDADAVGAAHAAVFAGLRPATTMVGVAGLIAPWMKVEIEADAIVGSGIHILDAGAPVVREAGLNDAVAVGALLRACGLPVPGEQDRPVGALVVERGGRIIGCVGYEDHGQEALLRSLAVDPEHRGERLATTLVKALLRRFRGRGVQRVWLLTMLDTGFFAKLGFRPARRDAVPAHVGRSHEFTIHACDAATVMTRCLDDGGPL